MNWKRPQIDDLLIFAGLAVTIPHTAHILCGFEAQDGWGYFVAWSFATFTDVGIARCSWVASNRQASKAARWAYGSGLAFLLVVSYSLNIAFYGSQKAEWYTAGWLALVAPVILAALAAGKSLLDNKLVEIKEAPPAKPLVTSAADSSAPLDDIQAFLLEEAGPQAGTKIKDMTPEQRSAFYKSRAAKGRQAMLAKREAQQAGQ